MELAVASLREVSMLHTDNEVKSLGAKLQQQQQPKTFAKLQQNQTFRYPETISPIERSGIDNWTYGLMDWTCKKIHQRLRN